MNQKYVVVYFHVKVYLKVFPYTCCFQIISKLVNNENFGYIILKVFLDILHSLYPFPIFLNVLILHYKKLCYKSIQNFSTSTLVKIKWLQSWMGCYIMIAPST
jgi:hypothetical protein